MKLFHFHAQRQSRVDQWYEWPGAAFDVTDAGRMSAVGLKAKIQTACLQFGVGANLRKPVAECGLELEQVNIIAVFVL